MEAWRKVWREGLAPLLPTAGLEALAIALAADDPAVLTDGNITRPIPISSVLDWPCEAADPIALRAAGRERAS